MLPIIIIIVVGLINSYASLKSFNGGSFLWPLLTGQLSVITWTYITKQSFSPWMAAILFDGLYCISWYTGAVLQGQKVNLFHIIGALFVICGIIITSVGSK